MLSITDESKIRAIVDQALDRLRVDIRRIVRTEIARYKPEQAKPFVPPPLPDPNLPLCPQYPCAVVDYTYWEGRADGKTPHTCPVCQGSGRTRSPLIPLGTYPCRACKGTGVVWSDD